MRKAIVHEVTDEPGADGVQRCVMCGSSLGIKPGQARLTISSTAAVARLFPSGHVTELKSEITIGDEIKPHSDFVAGDDSGADVPHVPCMKLTPA